MAEIKDFLVGDTVKLTWINSGVTVDGAIPWSMRNGAETVVSSGSMVSSGNGLHYAFATLPDTPGLYVAETIATISGYPFKRRAYMRATLGEVD